MKKSKLFLLMVFSFLVAGCSTMNIEHYQNSQPKLELFEFFAGKTYAWGQFQDRSGKVLRRFTVDIDGSIADGKLILDEAFIYDDGEQQRRVWTIEKTAENNYSGTAADVLGKATGVSAGSALNWRYSLDLPYKDSSIAVKFDDWMFLQTATTMINRAEVTKWGFKVGEVTLFFSKYPIADNLPES